MPLFVYHLFTKRWREDFKPTVETYCSERKSLLKIILLIIDVAPGHPGALTEMYNKINAGFISATTTSILQPVDQEVISTFKSYYLRNTFPKALAGDSSDGPGQSQLKTLWKEATIANAIKDIHDSWEKVKMSI
jgi:hypothetical protein